MKHTISKLIFLILIIQIISNFRVQSQTRDILQTEDMLQTVDSLRLLLKQVQVDSLKIEILSQLANLNRSIDNDISIEYYKKALNYDIEESRKADLINNIGLCYWDLGKFNEALGFFNQSLLIYNELNDSIRIGMVTNNIASSNWNLGKWNDALRIYQEGLKIRMAVNDRKGVSTILNNIGLVYQDFGVYDEAHKYHNEALDIALEINNFNAITYSYANLGNCYKMKKELDSALEYHLLGFKIYSENETNGRNNSYYLANIGMVYIELGKIDSALLYFHRSLEQAKSKNNELRVAIAEYNLGKTYLQLGEIDNATGFIEKSYHHALENSYQDVLRDNEFVLAELEELKGNANLALAHFKNAEAYRDSLFNKDEISKFIELTIRQIKEKEVLEKALLRENIEKQKTIIREERIIQWLLVAVGFILMIALIYIARSRESIKKLNNKLLNSEKELKQSNTDKDKFFSIISHDLKSPFNAIIGFSDLLLEQVKEKHYENIEKYSGIIYNSSQKAMNLLSNLIEWSLSQTGSMKFSPEIIDINIIVNENILLFTDIAKQKSITIINAVNSSSFVNADKAMINTVLRNLISNAVKFTPNGGNINISNKFKNNKVEISVSDTGVGLSKTIIEKLFRFDTQHSTKGTGNEKGTGLGLILCKELIELHHGEIWVRSEVDKGSVFYFTLDYNPNQNNK